MAFWPTLESICPPPPSEFRALNIPGQQKQIKPTAMTWAKGEFQRIPIIVMCVLLLEGRGEEGRREERREWREEKSMEEEWKERIKTDGEQKTARA